MSRPQFLELSGCAGTRPKEDRHHHGSNVPITWPGSSGLCVIPTEGYADLQEGRVLTSPLIPRTGQGVSEAGLSLDVPSLYPARPRANVQERGGRMTASSPWIAGREENKLTVTGSLDLAPGTLTSWFISLLL